MGLFSWCCSGSDINVIRVLFTRGYFCDQYTLPTMQNLIGHKYLRVFGMCFLPVISLPEFVDLIPEFEYFILSCLFAVYMTVYTTNLSYLSLSLLISSRSLSTSYSAACLLSIWLYTLLTYRISPWVCWSHPGVWVLHTQLPVCCLYDCIHY